MNVCNLLITCWILIADWFHKWSLSNLISKSYTEHSNSLEQYQNTEDRKYSTKLNIKAVKLQIFSIKSSTFERSEVYIGK